MHGHCERCDATVEAEFQHPTMRYVAYGYIAVIVPFLPLFPIFASDYFVCLPLFMLYMLGLGPVFAIIREPATCRECGAFLASVVKKRA